MTEKFWRVLEVLEEKDFQQARNHFFSYACCYVGKFFLCSWQILEFKIFFPNNLADWIIFDLMVCKLLIDFSDHTIVELIMILINLCLKVQALKLVLDFLKDLDLLKKDWKASWIPKLTENQGQFNLIDRLFRFKYAIEANQFHEVSLAVLSEYSEMRVISSLLIGFWRSLKVILMLFLALSLSDRSYFVFR